MARSTGASDQPEDTGRRVIQQPFPVETSVRQVGYKVIGPKPDYDIPPPEAPRQYAGERLAPARAWNKRRPKAG